MWLRLRLPWALATVVTVGHPLAGYADTKSKLNGSRLTLLPLLLLLLLNIGWAGNTSADPLTGEHSLPLRSPLSASRHERVIVCWSCADGRTVVGCERRVTAAQVKLGGFKDGGCLEDRSYLRADVVRRLFLARDRPQISTSVQARWLTGPPGHPTQLWHRLFWAEGEWRHLSFKVNK